MSEINGHSNFSVNQVNHLNYVKQNQIPEQELEQVNEEPKLKDFSDSKAEALGRSLLFKGNDDINNDLKLLVENPQIAENSDRLFDLAYQIAQENGAENPYEVAAEISTGVK